MTPPHRYRYLGRGSAFSGHQYKDTSPYEVNEYLAVVVAQLVERFTVNCIEKTKIKKKRPGMAHLKK